MNNLELALWYTSVVPVFREHKKENYEIKGHLSDLVREESVSVGDIRSWTKTSTTRGWRRGSEVKSTLLIERPRAHL